MRLDAQAAEQVAARKLERLFEQRVAQFAQMTRLKRLHEVALREFVPVVRRRRDGGRHGRTHVVEFYLVKLGFECVLDFSIRASISAPMCVGEKGVR